MKFITRSIGLVYNRDSARSSGCRAASVAISLVLDIYRKDNNKVRRKRNLTWLERRHCWATSSVKIRHGSQSNWSISKTPILPSGQVHWTAAHLKMPRQSSLPMVIAICIQHLRDHFHWWVHASTSYFLLWAEIIISLVQCYSAAQRIRGYLII